MSVEIFEQHRGLLTGVAYRILGSAADAEDVVQEAWLRWSAVDAADVAEPRAYLIRVVSRLAIDRLRQAAARRESYVGPWLPEPVSTEPDAAERAELVESVELALLVVLETLSPLERAVFVLREAFDLPHAEIARAVGRSEAAVRQLARRARDHVHERKPRFDADRTRRRQLTERFAAACLTGDLDGLTGLLAHDVTLVGDGGGRGKAPLRVITGADRVSRFFLSITSERNLRRALEPLGAAPDALGVAITEVNGWPAVVVTAAGQPITVISPVVAAGRIQTVYLITNPEKMSHLRLPDPSR
ncbi:RNA polymerase sigma-70 factor [Thermobifida halotolerans]|uniref:RNA polymerase sigma-70 factor n=2 Tax=Thermobifida halotolerans TaxID=483545 RepID=A0A399G4G1_9ACTN|nr:RNA polymerase sigma-70 factor [Thermobifida halotolerans]UOE18400.1 RNA polymerase sigma-70 factor [Thermobifida halotolerans]